MILLISCVFFIFYSINSYHHIASHDPQHDKEGARSTHDFSKKKNAEEQHSPAQKTSYDDVKNLLLELELAIQKFVDNKPLQKFLVSEKNTLFARKNEALQAFSEKNYEQAHNIIKKAFMEMQEATQKWHEDFDKNLNQAKEFFAQENPVQASFHITQARNLKPNHVHAQEVEKDIQTLEKTLHIKKKMHIAQIENDQEKEYHLLQELHVLHPENIDIKKEIQRIVTMRKTQQYENAILQFHQALNDNHLEDAQKHIENAQNFLPQKTKIKTLQNILAQKKYENARLQLQKKLEKFIELDQWERAHALTVESLPIYPKDSEFQKWMQHANDIITLKKESQKYIHTPTLLQDENIQKKLLDTIEQTTLLQSLSPSLAKDFDTIKQLNTQYNHYISVQITSDNESDIRVRKVGYVGKVFQKDIMLKPGAYTIEASRLGYKTVLQNIEIVPQKSTVHITILCTEKI